MDFGSSAPLGIALLGLLLGMRHATDPDHVIAVTTILSRERRFAAAARIGVVWGLGHSVTVLAVGAAIIVFKLAVPVRIGLAMEFAVAIVLILLGVGAVAALMRKAASRLLGTRMPAEQRLVVHSHSHAHDGVHHRHPHVHRHAHQPSAATDRHDHGIEDAPLLPFASRRRMLKSFGVGLVHGLAGSAAIALLVLSAIPEPLWATLYLAVFCAGTMIGMGLITTAIATPLIFASTRMSALHARLVVGSGLLSFVFGLFLAYRIGVVDRLFYGAPVWTPH
jgi:high-affinity nickel-transport protein